MLGHEEIACSRCECMYTRHPDDPHDTDDNGAPLCPSCAMERLIDRSSLGTPEAKALRAQTSPHVVDEIMERMRVTDLGGGELSADDDPEDFLLSKLQLMGGFGTKGGLSLRAQTKRMMDSLTDKERRVLKMRFDIDAEPVTKERIMEIERKALEKLRTRATRKFDFD